MSHAPADETVFLMKKGTEDASGANWIYHDGVAYIFPDNTRITVSDTTATGNWRSINHQAWATEEPVKKEVFTLWIDHGVKPRNATYAYLVVPSGSAGSVDGYNKFKKVSIISNTRDLQAVKHTGLGRTEAVFYKPGKLKMNTTMDVSVGAPCILR
jgi:chondroitin AC lyase